MCYWEIKTISNYLNLNYHARFSFLRFLFTKTRHSKLIFNLQTLELLPRKTTL